ncbi:TetR/AcrR family transcriptional regulator [Nannocystis pusilla]|uniref:TetR/AcrR family transcriptional regulator n=1 Tax=Nannocystis pusilla TaxID=889268 RepID=A0A9X3F0Q4_9BACT|nr:TetR/AcrR family transcriptional regulator [Nannocystis pusilla]MCY1013867.1 TetR/AcrR family transcriptional regulator [Nannocystis pusilla]
MSEGKDRPTRARRARRPSGDDREQAILASFEALLERRALPEISIDDIARGAGISRPTFYFYFPSKDAVLLSLLDRMVEQARAERDAALASAAGDPARRGARRSRLIIGSSAPTVPSAWQPRTRG